MALTPGTRVGPYEVTALIGEGGMGKVYRARDPKLNRLVAIKVLPETTASDAESRSRFEREAQSIAALNHPNIVTIHSVEEADGVLFLTMELVDGQPLDTLVVKGGLPVTRLLALAIPLADAVCAAHQKGITHRDLKPANVMVTADGRVKVLDFGLAKLKESSPVAAGVSELPTRVLTGEGRIAEIDAAAAWYEKMIEAREIFAPVYAKSHYTAELRASPYWPKLARMMMLPDSAP